MTTTASCPRCGTTLPKDLARVCLSCYERVEGLPEGTPLGSGPSPHPLTWAAAGAALLVLISFLVGLHGLLTLLTDRGGHPLALLGAALGMVACALLLGAGEARRSASRDWP